MRFSPRELPIYALAPAADCGSGSVPVGYLATSLSRLFRTKVIDRTGLTAKYDITLDWTPDEVLVIDHAEPPSRN